MVLRETPSSVAMDATVFSGRVSRSRAWRICSAVIAGGEAGAAGAGGGKAPVGSFDDEFADEYLDNPALSSGSQTDELGYEHWVPEQSDGPSTQRSARGVHLYEVDIEGST